MNDTSRIGLICKKNREIEKERKILIEQRKNNTMKKEQIYVVIDSEEKRLRAIQILSDAKEDIWDESRLLKQFTDEMIVRFNSSDNFWWTTYGKGSFIISLDELEQMLNPKFVVKEIALSLDELQKQAEMHGFDLVKKERKIKAGDFGKFWDNDNKDCCFGFLKEIDESTIPYKSTNITWWQNFTQLTDEEKAQIQENW